MVTVRRHFRPEFLDPDRRDRPVPWPHRPGLRAIIKLLLEQTQQRLRAQNITLRLDDHAIDWIVDRGYQPEYGARPLRRAIGRELDRKLSRMLLTEELRPGQEVHGSVVEDRLELTVSESQPPLS